MTSKMFFLSSLLVFGFIGSAFGQSNCTADAAASSKTCYMAYFQQFGFSAVPQYQDWVSAWSKMVQTQGIGAENSLCAWQNTLDACLKPVIKGCNDTAGYQMILGLDSTNAREYFIEYVADRFECNEGFKSLMDNYYCYLSVEQTHEDEVLQCSMNLTQNINTNPFSCSFINDYINCMTTVYTKYCHASAGNLVCVVSELTMEASVPMCTSGMPACGNYGTKSTNMLNRSKFLKNRASAGSRKPHLIPTTVIKGFNNL